MLASEYIKALQELISEHGDGECIDSRDNTMSSPEPFTADDTGVDGDDRARRGVVFVLADQA